MLSYGVLDREKKTVQYLRRTPCALKRATGSLQLMEDGGALLGVFPHWQ
jgi:serine phosphatase RsbU (regulator of sigma subunit)